MVLFAVLVLLQVMSLPGQFAHMAETSPDAAHLRWPLLLFVVVVIVTVAALLMVVMRALLRQATSLRSEMDTVV